MKRDTIDLRAKNISASRCGLHPRTMRMMPRWGDRTGRDPWQRAADLLGGEQSLRDRRERTAVEARRGRVLCRARGRLSGAGEVATVKLPPVGKERSDATHQV